MCATPALDRSLVRIGQVYEQAGRSADSDVRFLAAKDRAFFAKRLRNCNNAQAPQARAPRDSPRACAAWVIQEKEHALAKPPTAGMLKAQIANSGFLDVETVERFPQEFVGVDASFAVQVDLEKTGPSSLGGTFTQIGSKRRHPVVVPDAKPATLNFFSVHPSVFSWFFGHMERQQGVLTLVMADDGVY